MAWLYRKLTESTTAGGHPIRLIFLFLFSTNAYAGSQSYELDLYRGHKILKKYAAEMTVVGPCAHLKLQVAPDAKICKSQGQADGLPNGEYNLTIDDQIPVLNQSVLIQRVGDRIRASKGRRTFMDLKVLNVIAETPKSTSWKLPMGNKRDIADINSMVSEKFGAGRNSYNKNHLHTGIDLPGSDGALVYSVSQGRVVFISFFETEGTIVTQHILNDASEVFVKYTHIAEPLVNIGQIVTPDTQIARLMNKPEFKKANWRQNHVHLEVRKNPSEKNGIRGFALNKKELERCCIDPISFLSARAGRKIE